MRRISKWISIPILAALVSTAGCSSSGASTRLPASADGEAGMHGITCFVDGSKAQVTAAGSFIEPLEYQPGATPPKGSGGWRLQLHVTSSGGHLVGFASEAVALGSTRWKIDAKLPGGANPTECDVTINQNSL